MTAVTLVDPGAGADIPGGVRPSRSHAQPKGGTV